MRPVRPGLLRSELPALPAQHVLAGRRAAQRRRVHGLSRAVWYRIRRPRPTSCRVAATRFGDRAGPPGTFAAIGSASCEVCDKGTYRRADDDQCWLCRPFSTTITNGSTGCYSCLEGYYRVPFAVDGSSARCDNHSGLGEEYFDKCCKTCSDVTGTRTCAAGTELTALPIRRGFWRATAIETTLYRCFYKRTFAARIVRRDGSRRRRGYDVDISRRRVAATPRPRRGYSAETSRGDAAAKTWKLRGDESR